MDLKLLIAALPVSLLILGPGAAKAGETINEFRRPCAGRRQVERVGA